MITTEGTKTVTVAVQRALLKGLAVCWFVE
jgi:hypothetical protein